MMSDAYDYSLVDKDLGKVYEILQVDKKPYPAAGVPTALLMGC